MVIAVVQIADRFVYQYITKFETFEVPFEDFVHAVMFQKEWNDVVRHRSPKGVGAVFVWRKGKSRSEYQKEGPVQQLETLNELRKTLTAIVAKWETEK